VLAAAVDLWFATSGGLLELTTAGDVVVRRRHDGAEELRLFAGTGFLGGLTTFSTFSGEAATLLDRGDYGWAGALITAHVTGSVIATLAGLFLVRALLRA